MTSERPDTGQPRSFLIRFPGGTHSPESPPATAATPPMDVGNGHADSHGPLDKGSPGKSSLQRHITPGSLGGESSQRLTRRRVHSANSADVDARLGESSSSTRAQFMTEPAKPRRVSYRRIQNFSPGHANSANVGYAGSSPLAISATLPPSDDTEDDPNILADLQRALQYKSRVEEQLRTGVTQPDVHSHSASFPSSPTPSTSHSPFFAKIPFVHSDSGLTERASPNDLDFSPSTGKAPMHPVPSSADDGSTLDWSGIVEDDEKRERKWSMGIHRKVAKDKTSPLSRKGFVDRQESVYEAKLDRIRSRTSDQTRRKARITREQLQHRYDILNTSATPASQNLNLAAVARWLDELDEERKHTMTEPEHFPWIRHLLEKRDGPSHSRSPWTLSAHIIDEYARSTPGMEISRQPIAYNFTEGVTNVEDIHSHAHDLGHALSRPTSITSTEHAHLSRQKSDDLISFEPMTVLQSRRNSAATDSKNSTDARVRSWQTSLTGVGQDSPDSASVTLAKDSPASSLRIRASTPQEKLSAQTSRTSEERRRYSSSGEQGRSLSPSRTPDNIPRARSPLSSISGISGRGKKNKRPAPASTQSDSSVVEHDQLDSGSDAAAKPRGGGLSLSRIGEDTVPDLSKEGEGRRQKRSMFRLSLDMKSPQARSSLEDVRNKLLPPISITELRTDVQLGPDGKPVLKSLSLPPPGKNGSSLFPSGGMTTTTGTTSNPSRISLDRQISSPIIQKRKREKSRRKARMSLPGSLRSTNVTSACNNQPAETRAYTLSLEYSRKKEHLDALRARNSRMKQLLQTAAKTISEYDEIQRLMAEKLGMNYRQIPADALEAICHDPSSTTGNTRRATGWKAVEEIHDRCERQEMALESFEPPLLNGLSPATMPDGGIYHRHIETLTSQLEELGNERLTIVAEVKRLVELLRDVKMLRDQLKPDLDETGKHTSLNYPELVRLESLLDVLIRRRNLLWRVVEIFVSFTLTFVAPFMKTFGRPIWGRSARFSRHSFVSQ